MVEKRGIWSLLGGLLVGIYVKVCAAAMVAMGVYWVIFMSQASLYMLNGIEHPKGPWVEQAFQSLGYQSLGGPAWIARGAFLLTLVFGLFILAAGCGFWLRKRWGWIGTVGIYIGSYVLVTILALEAIHPIGFYPPTLVQSAAGDLSATLGSFRAWIWMAVPFFPAVRKHFVPPADLTRHGAQTVLVCVVLVFATWSLMQTVKEMERWDPVVREYRERSEGLPRT